jgi:hypothetical protein
VNPSGCTTGQGKTTLPRLNADTIEPTFATPERPSELDPFADKLTAWLKTEAGKLRKQRRTLKLVHADLVALGLPVPMAALPPLPVIGERTDNARAADNWPRHIRSVVFPPRRSIPIRLE